MADGRTIAHFVAKIAFLVITYDGLQVKPNVALSALWPWWALTGARMKPTGTITMSCMVACQTLHTKYSCTDACTPLDNSNKCTVACQQMDVRYTAVCLSLWTWRQHQTWYAAVDVQPPHMVEHQSHAAVSWAAVRRLQLQVPVIQPCTSHVCSIKAKPLQACTQSPVVGHCRTSNHVAAAAAKN